MYFDHENRAAVTQCHGNQVTKITPAAWLTGTPALDFAGVVCSRQVVSLVAATGSHPWSISEAGHAR